MKNDCIAKALDRLGFEWCEDENGVYVIKDSFYDIFLLVSDDSPGMYEILAMAYLPEEYEDKQSLMEDVLDTVNSCGYPELRAELINGVCILSKVMKHANRHISKARLKKDLCLFSEAYDFFSMNVMLRIDMNNNPEEYGL